MLCQISIKSVLCLVGRENSCKIWKQAILNNLLVAFLGSVGIGLMYVSSLPFRGLHDYRDRIGIDHQMRRYNS